MADELPEEALAEQPENGEILDVEHLIEGEPGDQHTWEG